MILFGGGDFFSSKRPKQLFSSCPGCTEASSVEHSNSRNILQVPPLISRDS